MAEDVSNANYPWSGFKFTPKDAILDFICRMTTPSTSFKHYYYRWRGVHGWSSVQHGQWLFEAARTLQADGDVVEIGSFYGRSTICLALGTKIYGTGKVYAVDTHTGGVSLSKQYPQASKAMASLGPFLRNLVRFGIEDIVVPVVLSSRQAVKLWSDKPIRLLFIDGWHSYEECSHDILQWGQMISPSGAIAIHDFHWDDVRKAVSDYVPKLAGFGEIELPDPKMAVIYRHSRVARSSARQGGEL